MRRRRERRKIQGGEWAKGIRKERVEYIRRTGKASTELKQSRK